ncbi:extracellular solute-binding protein [Cohnella ginsengisoli]|uniref:Extracellular solute-binding protein n=1 Tax=Cohnella ginsengisoli TaxID=425004 RepID=A0A9X4KDL2_9BACL|nr:extracellular solute-binding protein [Cohnella ginsengisoli]MDG0790076.1 extracellular solute-binding protein [Cohnella ginsengisoli]
MSEPDPLVQRLEDKLNIKIKPVAMTGVDYAQQFQMWASSGQLPDIFAVDAMNSRYYKNWIAQGVVKALPENLSAYPHLKKYLSLPDIESLKADGKLYMIPRMTYDSTDYNILDRIVVYRWDLARKAGIDKEPETWDEFKAMLKAIVAQDPEKKNIAGLTSVSNLLLGGLFWLYSSPAATSDGSGSDYKWIKEDGRYIPAVFAKDSAASLSMLRDFYTSGLIDPDLPIMKGEMGFDKFAQGKVAALITSGMLQAVDTNIYKDRWLKLHPDETRFYDKVKVLKPLKSMDGNRYHAVFKSFWSESYISAKVDDKKMDRIMQLLDYMNTPEFLEMRRFGLQGVDYEKNGELLTRIHPEEDLVKKYKGMSSLGILLDWDGMFKLDPAYSGLSPEGHRVQQELLDYSIKMTRKQTFYSRLTYLSTPTKDGFSIYDNDDMIRVMLSKQPVEDAWEEIVKGYRAKGLDRLIEEVNQKVKEAGID